MTKLRSLLQKVRIEFLVLLSLLFSIIAFCTHYYSVNIAGHSGGYSIFNEVFGANIGWLLFLIVLSGYFTTIIFTTIDNEYSKRAKLSFATTVGFLSLLFFAVILSVIFANNDKDSKFYFGKETFFGVTLKGGFGFGFYWYIIHIIISGTIVLLYKEYQGKGEITCYRLLNQIVNKNLDTNKTNNNNNNNNNNNTGNKYDELTKIKKLLDDGVLTNEEYLKEKQIILEKYS